MHLGKKKKQNQKHFLFQQSHRRLWMFYTFVMFSVENKAETLRADIWINKQNMMRKYEKIKIIEIDETRQAGKHTHTLFIHFKLQEEEGL